MDDETLQPLIYPELVKYMSSQMKMLERLEVMVVATLVESVWDAGNQ
jgi:hypothetical protein